MSRELTGALEKLADVAGEQAGELRRARLERERERWDDPEHVAGRAAVRAPLRRPWWGIAAAVRIPGLVEQFESVVPAEFIAQVDVGVVEVACPCGEAPRVAVGQVAGCACGRFFLTDGRTVRSARYEPEDVAAAAEEAVREAAEANVD